MVVNHCHTLDAASAVHIGAEFIYHYYSIMNKSPLDLHRLYNKNSSFVHGGVEKAGHGTPPVYGQRDIHKKIMSLGLRDCRAKIAQVDSQPTVGGGVVVQVTGELSNDGQPMRRFMQTFVLAPQSAKAFYIYNDIFRYQDEVFGDPESSDSEQTPAVENGAAAENGAATENVAATENGAASENGAATETPPPAQENSQQLDQPLSNGAAQEGEAEAAPVVAMEKCQVAEETVVEVNTEAVNTEQTSDEVKPAQPSETPDGPNPELQPGTLDEVKPTQPSETPVGPNPELQPEMQVVDNGTSGETPQPAQESSEQLTQPMSNGSTQEEEAETASAVVTEKNKVAEDSDALKVEQPSDKVELAQPVEAPAEPEAELQHSAETEVAESTAPTETPQPAQESSEQSAQPMSNGCALEDGLEAAPAVVSENSKVAKEADGESCSSEQTSDKVEPAHSTEAQAEPEPEPQTVEPPKAISWAELVSKASCSPDDSTDMSSKPAPASRSQPLPTKPRHARRAPREGNSKGSNESVGNSRDRGGVRTTYPDNHQLFVGNIRKDIQQPELKAFFNEWGTVVALNIKSGSGRLPNFGFVVFDSPDPVQEILKQKPIKFNGQHRLNVEEKKSRGGEGRRSGRGASRGSRGSFGYTSDRERQGIGRRGVANGGAMGSPSH